jgi:DNA replication protein DnaC
MAEVCALCEGSGMRVVERAGGLRVAEACVCRAELKSARLLAQARIPARHMHCTLENFETQFSSADRSLGYALQQARNFARAYPLETEGKGLLFAGEPGRGKTHLAVGLLRTLIGERGARGLFVDYRDLLKQVQNTYDPGVAATELGILRPVFEAEVLVIDDLGASKPTDWVFDTVAHVLNSRYNDQLTTIITTNYANLPETAAAELGRKNEAQRVMAEKTLGDRIGNRVLSRLQEMCVAVEMAGDDFRQKVKRARFG